jgi:hypothetical protein
VDVGAAEEVVEEELELLLVVGAAEGVLELVEVGVGVELVVGTLELELVEVGVGVELEVLDVVEEQTFGVGV